MIPPSPALLQALRLAAPRRFAAELRRVAAKLVRRARRIEERVVRLEPDGPARGDVLFSFILDPFLLPPGRPPSHDHTHDWESLQMALTFVDRGFSVDAIHWSNTAFVPRRAYSVVVDVRLNLERLAPLLPDATRILHIETAHPSFHNAAQERRLADLATRRGRPLPPNRLIEPNDAIEHAHAATILGNEFTASTYAFAGKPLYRVPISNPYLYPSPEGKDFAAARRRFLWFGSGGLVHKGLDRVLEAFAGLPDLHLTVCGPIARERAFEREYWRELYRTPNVRTLGWIDVAGAEFRRLAGETLAVVYPSCSEGGGGSVVTCLHAGLIPVVTRETSVDVDPAWGVLLGEASVDEIREAVTTLAARPPAALAAMAQGAWSFARERHTREAFAAGYAEAVDAILARFPPGRPRGDG